MVKNRIFVTNKLSNAELSRKTGYYLGYGVYNDLSLPGSYWSWELGLGSRGYVAEFGDSKTSLMAHNIQFAPSVGFKYEVYDDVKVDLHLGLYTAIDYAGRIKYEDGDYEEKANISDFDDEYNRFDLGLGYGFGVWYQKKYNLDFSFQNGFVNSFSDGKNKTRNFMLRLGYAF
ncbi:MAG: outer membrane beta-barrel protein [Rikenellaceae bacterium]